MPVNGKVTRGLPLVVVLGLFGLASVSRQEPGSIQGNPFAELADKTIMVISPHPDDDIIGCGGALAFLSGRGNRLIAVFLTAGEKGTFDLSMTPARVRKIRMREAAAAYRVLGFPNAQLIWFHYPDGELDFAPLRQIRMRLAHLIRKHRPDVLFALDPGATYYRYHYRDHRSAALVSADAVGAAMWPLEYRSLGPAFKVPQVFYFYTAEPSLRLDISQVNSRKLEALSQHRSQFPPASEHYRSAGPPPSQADLEALIKPLTGGATTEFFRRR